MARPMTHLRLTCSLICFKNTYQTQPDMKAYFRALSSHSSAMMVYLKKCFAKIFTNIYFPPCSDTNREETCSESSEDKERPVMVADMERNKPGGLDWVENTNGLSHGQPAEEKSKVGDVEDRLPSPLVHQLAKGE